MPYAAPRHQPRSLPIPKRASAAKRLYDRQWRNYREAWFADPDHALCAWPGCRSLATILDHKIPHKGDEGLFWDPENHQSLCKPHHDEKTAREDGGFGRPAIKPGVAK